MGIGIVWVNFLNLKFLMIWREGMVMCGWKLVVVVYNLSLF